MAQYRCGPRGGDNGAGVTGQGALLSTLRMGDRPAVLAAEIHLPKLGPSPARLAQFRPDDLGGGQEAIVDCITRTASSLGRL